MRDRLGLAAWWNRPIVNPTQTAIARFLKMPYSELESDFTKSQNEWNEFKKTLTDITTLEEV
jgi:hypothetical protein